LGTYKHGLKRERSSSGFIFQLALHPVIGPTIGATKDSHGDSRLPSFMLSVDAVPDHAIVRKIEVYQFPCFCKLRYKQINVIGNLLNAKGNSTNYYST